MSKLLRKRLTRTILGADNHKLASTVGAPDPKIKSTTSESVSVPKVEEITASSANITTVPEGNITAASLDANSSSRRKMLKGLGLAAASLAVAGSAAVGATENNVAQAASGDMLLAGNSNLASNTTYISQTGQTTTLNTSGPNAVLWADYNTNSQSPVSTSANLALAATSTTSDNSGIGGFFQGDRAPILLAPGTGSGAPSASGHSTGELYVDGSGILYIFNGTSWNAVGTNANSSGTSFPTNNLSDGQRFYRSDLYADFVYNVNTTSWVQIGVPGLSAFPTNSPNNLRVYRNDYKEQFRYDTAISPSSWVSEPKVSTFGLWPGMSTSYPWPAVAANSGFLIYDLAYPLKTNNANLSVYIEYVELTFYVTTTLDATNYWTLAFYRQPASNPPTNYSISSVTLSSTNGYSANIRTTVRMDVNQSYTGSSGALFFLNATPSTASVGGIYVDAPTLSWRVRASS